MTLVHPLRPLPCLDSKRPQVQPSGPEALCDEHRALAVVIGGVAFGGAITLFVRALAEGASNEPDYLEWFGGGFLAGASGAGLYCWFATGRVW